MDSESGSMSAFPIGGLSDRSESRAEAGRARVRVCQAVRLCRARPGASDSAATRPGGARAARYARVVLYTIMYGYHSMPGRNSVSDWTRDAGGHGPGHGAYALLQVESSVSGPRAAHNARPWPGRPLMDQHSS